MTDLLERARATCQCRTDECIICALAAELEAVEFVKSNPFGAVNVGGRWLVFLTRDTWDKHQAEKRQLLKLNHDLGDRILELGGDLTFAPESE